MTWCIPSVWLQRTQIRFLQCTVPMRTFQCTLSYYEQGNFDVYNNTNSPFRSLHSKTMMSITLSYYEQEDFVSTILLRTVHSVRYVQNYSFSICTCTTLSYYEQGRYSVVYDIYCFTANIPFRLLLMNMQIHVPKWRVVTHYTHLPTNIPPAQYTYFSVFIYLCQEA